MQRLGEEHAKQAKIVRARLREEARKAATVMNSDGTDGGKKMRRHSMHMPVCHSDPLSGVAILATEASLENQRVIPRRLTRLLGGPGKIFMKAPNAALKRLSAILPPDIFAIS